MSISKVTRNTGTRYKARVRLDNGKQTSRTFKRKYDAEQWEREQIRQRESVVDQPIEELYFAELVDLWLERHASSKAGSTQQRYQDLLRLHILPAFSDVLVSEISIRDVDDWWWGLQSQSKLHAKTLNMVLTLLKSVLSWAQNRRLLLHNPAAATSSLSISKDDFVFWTSDEAERFLAFHEDSPHLPLFVAALNTGMRLNELVGLRWDAVDLVRGRIRVFRTWCNKEQRLKETTKGRKGRSIPINQTLRKVFAQRKLETTSNEVFVHIDSQRFTQREFRPACVEAEVTEIRFHDLRHTFASHFVMNGGNLYALQKILGHHSVTMTEKYAHLSPDYLQDAADIVEFGQAKNATVTQLKKAGS